VKSIESVGPALFDSAAFGVSARWISDSFDSYRGAYTMRDAMVYPYSNATQTRWDRGELRVQLNVPDSTRPTGYCDGSDADMSELSTLAETEGAEGMRIEKKVLKSGREIWTLYAGD
jgi:hypothetical protein